jgi:hypothetical protein
MRDGTEEWKIICEQAAQEQDPEKLMKLTQRITELLDERIEKARRRNPENTTDVQDGAGG